MTVLRIGYELLAGSSQSGTDSGIMGNIVIETAKSTKHFLTIRRLSDNYYWNNTSAAFQSGDPAEADEYPIPGSDEIRPKTVRILKCKIPGLCRAGITSAGFTVIAYATGDTPSSAGVTMTLTFAP
jgi:hypothetical protein